MSSWSGTGRTNYVVIADEVGLKAYLNKFGDVSIGNGGGEKEGKHCFLAKGEYGDFPSTVDDDETGEELQFEWEDVCKFLAPEQVLIVMSSGAEGHRYVTGDAAAYLTTDGSWIYLSLTDIYRMAADKFGVALTSINPAEY